MGTLASRAMSFSLASLFFVSAFPKIVTALVPALKTSKRAFSILEFDTAITVWSGVFGRSLGVEKNFKPLYSL